LKILWNKKVVGSPEGIPQQVNHRNFGKVHLGPQQNLGNKNSRFFVNNFRKYFGIKKSLVLPKGFLSR